MPNERSSKAERRKAATIGRSYDEIKEAARERSAAASQTGRDIAIKVRKIAEALRQIALAIENNERNVNWNMSNAVLIYGGVNMLTVSEMYDYLLHHSKDTGKQIRIEYQVVKAMNGDEK